MYACVRCVHVCLCMCVHVCVHVCPKHLHRSRCRSCWMCRNQFHCILHCKLHTFKHKAKLISTSYKSTVDMAYALGLAAICHKRECRFCAHHASSFALVYLQWKTYQIWREHAARCIPLAFCFTLQLALR